MNNKKICFIMCSNDEMLANECLLYIEQLNVPEGFTIETMVVEDAKCMTEGYNYAMNSSDAKYKIYLHNDVLLTYRDMLKEIVSVFENNPDIGMLGVVGNTSLAKDYCAWSVDMDKRVGKVMADLIDASGMGILVEANADYQTVLLIDGLFMATQYDIPWREDLFTGWDFYDCSQSLEFWKAGYKVAVPHMDNAWCLHDNDFINLENYYMWAEVFKKEYKELCERWNGSSFDNKVSDEYIQLDKNVNQNKIDFIICYNNELYLQECVDYIKFLNIPEGMEIDIISIHDAKSMAAGYNAAMESSDAKYKVYLHQDVFIINENFIYDVVDTFRKNSEYGLLGVLGCDRQIEDACYWDKWNTGVSYVCNALNAMSTDLNNPLTAVEEVVAVDGMIMITQYDVPWREDIFDGFDFYDISQCMEFAKAGYKVGVPHQDNTWCLHDFGVTKFTKYNHYRRMFCEEYGRIGYSYKDNDFLDSKNEMLAEAEKLVPQIELLIEHNQLGEAQDILIDIMKLGCYSTRICHLYLLCVIKILEEDAGIKSGFGQINDIDVLIKRLALVRFALKRLEFDKAITGYEEVFEWLLRDCRPLVALQEIMEHSVINKQKVINEISVLQGMKVESEIPLVTVIVSVYNAENIIEDTLRSIMKQSYRNMQILVVDDCSKDSSRAIIDRLAIEDNRIEKVYMSKNSHVCKATNEAYKLARGKYIALIGHDDIWIEDKLAKQVGFMELNPEYAVAFTLAHIIDDYGNICAEQCKGLYGMFNRGNRSQKEWAEFLFMNGNTLCAPSALIRKECIKAKNIYQFGLVQLQDYALWLDILIDYPIYIIREYLTLYRHFMNSDDNLSTCTPERINRLSREGNYIFKRYLNRISNEKFRMIFSSNFVNKSAATADELKCERAFLMMKRGNSCCVDMFMELFEDDVTRDILENVYGFSLIDFYKVSAHSFAI